MSKIEGDVFRNVGTDASGNSKGKLPKNTTNNVQEAALPQEENQQAYKVELSSIAKSISPKAEDNVQDMAKKVEELKTKITSGSYEIDTNKIVQGMLKYF